MNEPWMTREQCPQPPPRPPDARREMTWPEAMARPLLWEEWLAERPRPVDVPCGHDNEGD